MNSLQQLHEHRFIFIEDGVFEVKCMKTGGSFSTNLWKAGKETPQKCPCCQEIKHGN